MDDLALFYYRCSEQSRELLKAMGYGPRKKSTCNIVEAKEETLDEIAEIMSKTPEQILNEKA